MEVVFQLGQLFLRVVCCEQSGIRPNPKKRRVQPGIVACTCNPATLETELRNGVGLKPVGGNSSSLGR